MDSACKSLELVKTVYTAGWEVMMKKQNCRIFHLLLRALTTLCLAPVVGEAIFTLVLLGYSSSTQADPSVNMAKRLARRLDMQVLVASSQGILSLPEAMASAERKLYEVLKS